MSPDDIKYVGAAWKMGALNLDPIFDHDLTAEEFKALFQWYARTNYGVFQIDGDGLPVEAGLGAWTFIARSKRGKDEPVGFYLGWVRGRIIQTGAMIWFPWASHRNVIESAVNFFDKMRREHVVIDFAEAKDKKFFETICRHGVMRRIGTSYEVYPDDRCVVFETVSVKHGS